MIKSIDYEYEDYSHEEIIKLINDMPKDSNFKVINIETIITAGDYFVRVWYIE